MSLRSEMRSLLLLLVLLVAASGSLLAQEDRSLANDSSDRVVDVPRSEPDSPPSDPPPDSPSDPSSPPPPDTPSDPSPDTSSNSTPPERYAVPGTPGEAHRQPPSRDRHAPGTSGGESPQPPSEDQVDQDVVLDTYDEELLLPYLHEGRNREMGALDLDVSPGRTQVYLDGQYIGVADQYDGWPSYLWLERGTYDIVFYLNGYETLARQVSVHPGMVINFEDRLVRGESIRPEDLASRSRADR